MPSEYAHHRFGKEVLQRLPEEISHEITKNTVYYDIGVHGPDIFYYYHLWMDNAVRKMGLDMHMQVARTFFEESARTAARYAYLQEMRVYLFGFLCHYALDSASHTYIENQARRGSFSHCDIEGEFDRMLMEKDRLDPVRHFRAGSIKINREIVTVIQMLFPQLRIRQVQSSLRSMKRCVRFLTNPGIIQRSLFWLILKSAGRYQELKGQMIGKKTENCEETNLQLECLYEIALDDAVLLIRQYYSLLRGEISELGKEFEKTYGLEPECGWNQENAIA